MSMEDSISLAPHSTLDHLYNKNACQDASYFLQLNVQHNHTKYTHLQTQWVRIGHNISSTLIQNINASQCCVFRLLLCTQLTFHPVIKYMVNSIFKFTNDTTIDLVNNNDDMT